MAQDWSMIPLHLRCTERFKIDPNYPDDDARWWQRQLRRPNDRHPAKPSPERTSDEQRRVLEYIREHGPVTVTDIRFALGFPRGTVLSLVDGLSKTHPIYQEMKNGLYAYELLPQNDPRKDTLSELQESIRAATQEMSVLQEEM